MVPVFLIFYCDMLMENSSARALASAITTMFPMLAVNPYESLFWTMLVAYVPMGLRLIIQVTSPVDSLDNFDNPRKIAAQLDATNPLSRRLNHAHMNSLEHFPFFAAGVLAAMQVGVNSAIVTDHCIIYLASRAVYCTLYALQVVPIISPLRSGVWFVGTVAVAKLLLLAGQA